MESRPNTIITAENVYNNENKPTIILDLKKFNKEKLMLSSDRECRSFIIGWLEKNPNCTVKYFEICNGDNFSDYNSLVAWGGKNGYFSNILDDDFPAQRSRVSSREIEKIKKCEVDIDSYLNIQ